MFALIKREIEDKFISFLITTIFVATIVGTIVYKMYTGLVNDQMFGIPSIMYKAFSSSPLMFLPFIAAVLGVLQMYSDKDKNISSFLSTLGTTRRQILTAKIITGILWILLVLLPVAIAEMILLQVFPRAALTDVGFFANIFFIIFLNCLACYAFGLQIGWNRKKLLPAFGMIFVIPVLTSLTIIKGVDSQTVILLLLFATAAIVRTWQKFMSTPL